MTQNIETVQIPDTAAALATPPRAVSEVHSRFVSNGPISMWSLSVSGYDIKLAVLFDSKVSEIQNLGSADEIAAFFRKNGIKGDRNILASCPIANHFTRETGTACTVDAEGVIMNDPKNNEQLRFAMSDGMKEFIKNFDQGMYPDLVA